MRPFSIHNFKGETDFDVDFYKKEMNEKGVFLAKFDGPIDFLGLVESIGVPHSHDTKGSYVWDVKPNTVDEGYKMARSQTFGSFSFHTDCSFESPSPRYVALYVIRQDRCGGGVSRLIDFHDVYACLSAQVRIELSGRFTMRVPDEFRKNKEESKVSIMFDDDKIRYRRECIFEEGCTPAQIEALNQLDQALAQSHQTKLLLPDGAVLFLDNARFLHSRTAVKDKNRHLQRIRFNV